MRNFILLISLLSSLSTIAQNVLLNGESGNINIDIANCWSFGGHTYINNSLRLSGNFSLQSGPASIQSFIMSPWLKPLAGNITLKIKLSPSNGTARTLAIEYIPYDQSSLSASKEGTPVSFYSYTLAPVNPNLVSLSFPVPSAIAGSSSPFKIKFTVIGNTGNSRILSDDINIPGTYWANPSNSCLPTSLIADADNDGVADADDAYPQDATRAYNTFYPAGNFGTLMFEDLWPAVGDYDFNDLVVDYRYNLITNANNKVVEMKCTFVTRAIGASFRNGFAFQLDDLPASKINSVSGAKYHNASWIDIASNGIENNQSFVNIIVFDDAQKVLPSPGGSGTNTLPNNLRVAPDTTYLSLNFLPTGNNAISVSDIKFNPYLIINQDRGREVHLPNNKPSAKANAAFFGTQQDNSNPSQEKFYKSNKNLPWALNVNSSIPYTHTTHDFLSGYLKFAEWAQSSGSLYSDWYLDLPGYRDSSKLFEY